MSVELRTASAHRHTVLIVDDEQRTVTAVKHLLRRKYNVLGATRASDALEMLKTSVVSVVLSDQRMPEMTGDEFLGQIRLQYPDTVRILITAYSDMQALVRTVNQGQIFGFLAKPWAAEELERMIESAIRFREVVDEKRKLAKELVATNGQLTRVNAELRSFAHVVAHDLKEPLRTIGTYSRFLEQDCRASIGPQGITYLDGITRCSDHLHQLIDDLLRMSEVDNTPLQTVEIDIRSIISQAVELLGTQISESGAQVELPEPGVRVSADIRRLSTVFQNLISNAIKFNQSDVPRIRVEAQADEQVLIRVIDNGIGISPEYADRIFGLFERLHGRSEYPGTGAGLAIVKKIVEAHGGSVRAIPSEEGGTVFEMTLPTPV